MDDFGFDGTGVSRGEPLDDGIRVSLHLDCYDGGPELRAGGSCLRYRHNYGDVYDYMYDDNGDGAVDALERSN